MFRAYQQPIIRMLNVYMAKDTCYASKLSVSGLTVNLEVPFAIYTFNLVMIGC
jgi:hypothetical protein